MKRTGLFLVAMVCMLMQSVTSFADDKIIPVEQLPATAKNFVKEYFSYTTISYATKDVEYAGTTYEARLANGTEIDFDKKGNWAKVDCKMKAVPASLVPAVISKYVKANHPSTKITKIDKKRYGYEIELSNDLELKFDKYGKLIGFDD